MEELNSKLAEWANEKVSCPVCRGNIGAYSTMGNCSQCNATGKVSLSDWEVRPDFTHSLDACFKWLVPKLREDYNELMIRFMFGSVTYCTISYWGKRYSRKKNFEWLTLAQASEAPALALCRAIEKLIDAVQGQHEQPETPSS